MDEQDWIALRDHLRQAKAALAALPSEQRRNLIAALDAVQGQDVADWLLEMMEDESCRR
jgi:hypothetical protein